MEVVVGFVGAVEVVVACWLVEVDVVDEDWLEAGLLEQPANASPIALAVIAMVIALRIAMVSSLELQRQL
ncbi:MAG TPA: hypothetical protein VGH31_02075 [Acidimicrobiales bacterium]